MVGLFVAGDALTFGGVLAVRVVTPVAGFAAVQGYFAQAACRVPFIVGDFPTYADSDLETVMQNTMLQIYLD